MKSIPWVRCASGNVFKYTFYYFVLKPGLRWVKQKRGSLVSAVTQSVPWTPLRMETLVRRVSRKATGLQQNYQ